MGDYAPATLILHAVPDEVRGMVHDLVVGEWGLMFDWSDPAPEDELWLNHVYGDPEARLNISQDLVADLVKLGVTFTLHTDAKFEWDGDISIHVPELGLFSATCTQDGEPVVPAGTLDKMIAEVGITGGTVDILNLQDLVQKIDDATGKAWRDAVDKLTPDPDNCPVILPL